MRGSPSDGHVVELDGLRGIAILLVMVHRVYPRAGDTPWPIEAGWIGVDLFFVISGYLIAGILLDTRDDPHFFRNFYARRVLRIFPLFYVFVGGMLLAFPLAGHAGFLREAGSPLWYLAHLGNVPEGLLGLDPPYWLAPVWSLAIEEQFYLTFPLVMRAVRPRRLALYLVSAIFVALVVRVATTAAWPDRERIQYLFTLCRLDTIAAGCLLAIIVRTRWFAAWRAHLTGPLLALFTTCAFIATATHLDRTTLFGRTLGYSVVAAGFAALVLLVVLYRGRASTAWLRFGALTYLGKLCFGLYLLHRPADTVVTALIHRAGLDDTLLLWIPIKLAVAVGLATLSWIFLEQRFLRLKRLFASRSHPQARAPRTTASLAAAGVVVLLACTPTAPGPDALPDVPADMPTFVIDAAPDPPDAAPPEPTGRVLYSEQRIHSPITADLAGRLGSLVSPSSHPRVFAKVGDSITATPSFLTCFDSAFDLGGHGSLSSTLTYFRAGDAGGATPFSRTSLAATGGWTAADLLAAPAPLDRELAALSPRLAILLLGTNDVRYGRSLDAFGADLWTIVDRTLARGVLPILSTLPAMHGDPESNARIPLFNRAIRALAQGRSVPLIDYHLALAALPNEGISADGIHPTDDTSGSCLLTADGLRHGYNLRNLITLEALDRVRRSLAGHAPDATAPRRAGSGTPSDPFRGPLPVLDLADTRAGSEASPSLCGLPATGRRLIYRLDLPATTALDVFAIDRDPVDIDVAIASGSVANCLSSGDQGASAVAGPGPTFVIVASRSGATEGEFVVVASSM